MEKLKTKRIAYRSLLKRYRNYIVLISRNPEMDELKDKLKSIEVRMLEVLKEIVRLHK